MRPFIRSTLPLFFFLLIEDKSEELTFTFQFPIESIFAMRSISIFMKIENFTLLNLGTFHYRENRFEAHFKLRLICVFLCLQFYNLQQNVDGFQLELSAPQSSLIISLAFSAIIITGAFWKWYKNVWLNL